MSLHERIDYESTGLDTTDVAGEPLAQWGRWYDEAAAAMCVEPNAMVVATVDDAGVPDARNVLVRGADERGVVFFTNYESSKSRQMDARPAAAGVFSWLEIHRQVKMRGAVERVSAGESDEYFASRPRDSQLGAWASPQSQVLRDRAELEERLAEVTTRFGNDVIPRPPHWGGWRLVPAIVEFWQGRPSRLHDRLRYRLDESGAWLIERLAP